MASEIYLQMPADFGDFRGAAPGTPLLALLKFGSEARALRDLHLQMVIYAKMQGTGGFVPDYMVGLLAYPDPAPVAKHSADRLAEVGFAEITEGGYYVAAAESWPPLLRTGTRDPIPDSIRKQVYERDGYRCTSCGAEDDLTLDHIVPWSRCGPDTVKNLQVLCASLQ